MTTTTTCPRCSKPITRFGFTNTSESPEGTIHYECRDGAAKLTGGVDYSQTRRERSHQRATRRPAWLRPNGELDYDC